MGLDIGIESRLYNQTMFFPLLLETPSSSSCVLLFHSQHLQFISLFRIACTMLYKPNSSLLTEEKKRERKREEKERERETPPRKKEQEMFRKVYKYTYVWDVKYVFHYQSDLVVLFIVCYAEANVV